MTVQDFTDSFLPTLSQLYLDGELDLHALVDLDTWNKVFPDNMETRNNLLWYQIKLNAFVLQDGTGLIVYSLMEPTVSGQRKFIGIRFDNKKRDLHYYILVRPRYYDSPWEIYQYSFPTKKYVFDFLIDGTHSLRDFVNTIGMHEPTLPKSFVGLFKEKLRETFGMQ